MKKTSLFFFIILLANCALSQNLADSSSSFILKRYYEATGRLENWKNVKSRIDTISYVGLENQSEKVSKENFYGKKSKVINIYQDSLFYCEMYIERDENAQFGYNGKQYWYASDGGMNFNLPKDQSEFIMELTKVGEPLKIETAQNAIYQGEKQINGETYHAILCSYRFVSNQIYLFEKDSYLLAYSHLEHAPDKITKYEDYKNIDGLLISTKTITHDSGILVGTTIYEKVLLNQKIFALRIFERL
ncbi:MAG: hypothetical protein ACJAWV_001535 [Flammeovirgaceae bacterium]|jgi:hypothetical protein